MSNLSYPSTVNGWELRFSAVFIQQFVDLRAEVESLKDKDPENYRSKRPTKRFLMLLNLVYEIIPQDPERSEYRQGETLGSQYKHWFRAKFFQQYRLFFRYNKEARIIIFSWVNDEKTKRAYGSKTDAYRVFSKMLESGNPPDDWDALLAASATIDLEEFI